MDRFDEAVSGGASPFGRGVVTDWHDGPVGGAVECGGEVFLFQMVAWDARGSARVFVLQRPGAPVSLEDLAAIHRDAGEPRWPWWAPVRYSSEEARVAAAERTDAVAASAGPPEYLLLATDLSERVEQMVRLDGELQERVQQLLRTAMDAGETFPFSDVLFDEWRALLAS